MKKKGTEQGRISVIGSSFGRSVYCLYVRNFPAAVCTFITLEYAAAPTSPKFVLKHLVVHLQFVNGQRTASRVVFCLLVFYNVFKFLFQRVFIGIYLLGCICSLLGCIGRISNNSKDSSRKSINQFRLININEVPL